MANNNEDSNSVITTSSSNQSANQLENIKVAVRLRPFTEKERSKNSQRIVDMEHNTVALYNPKWGDSSSKKFTFDYSYWSHDGFKRDATGANVPDESHPNCAKYTGQERVFEDLGRFLLENALKGYNSALLAYGQTGSGKSYTVSGYGQNEGILPRFARALFEELDKRAQVIQQPCPAAAPTQEESVADTKVAAGAGDSGKRHNRYEVHFSMLEIYNEVVRDLLAKSHGYMIGQSSLARRGLKVREHPKRGFFVENLSSYACTSKSEIELRIEEGQLNKSIAATSMNETSSRGHTIYEFRIKQYVSKSPENPEETLTTSVVQLVDLAGSERMAVHVTGSKAGIVSDALMAASRSNSPFPRASGTERAAKSRASRLATSASSSASFAINRSSSPSFKRNPATQTTAGGSVRYPTQNDHQQQRFKESVSINQSLSALGNCIQVLSQYSQQIDSAASSNKRSRPKIPYRDSVLTKLLNKCCLSGNSKVVIIATLSPSESNYDDTLSTLRFADRAKQIRTHAVVNRMSRGQIVDALQKENERLKQMIDGRTTRSDDSSQTSNFDDSENMMENFNGPKTSDKLSSSKAIDAVATPTRSRTVRKSRAAQHRASRHSKSKLASASSNPALSTDDVGQMDRLVSPASRELAAAQGIHKSRSVGYCLSNADQFEDGPEGVEDLEDLGLIDERELGDIKEGLISSDSEDSFGNLEVDGLSNDEKIGLFNRLLSNSKVASKIEQSESGPQNKIPRPKKVNRTQTGIENISMLSSSLRKSNPYLSNLNPDEQLTGMISYIIKQGETIVGKNNDCDIVLHGPELRARHAKITRESNSSSNQTTVFIEPILEAQNDGEKQNVALMVNGLRVNSKKKLNHCDRLLFGSNSYFVFIDNVGSEQHTGDTIANLDLVTFDMARNEVLRKIMSDTKNEAMIKEINSYTHRPGTGKHKVKSEDSKEKVPREAVQKATATSLSREPSDVVAADAKRGDKKTLKLMRSITIQDSAQGITSSLDQKDLAESPEKIEEVNESKSESPDGTKEAKTDSLDEGYRERLMEDTYEFAMPVAEVNAIAKEMGLKVTYGLKILTGEEQLPDQLDTSYFDSNVSDGGFSSSSLGETGGPMNSAKDKSKDDRVTVLKRLDSLDVPPALFVQVHLEEQNINFYWSKDKFQARRYKILELYGAWDVGGKSGLVEYLIDQSRNQGEYLFDPFIDDPASTLVLIGHAQITLQPISYLSDIDQDYDVLSLSDEIAGSIRIQAIPCHAEERTGNEYGAQEPFRPYSDQDLETKLLDDPNKLLGKKLVFLLKILSCRNIPDKYTNVFCQYTFNRDKPIVRTNILRDDSLEIENSDDNEGVLSFNYSHYICFDKVTQDTLDFLEHGFLTVQIVGQYKLTEKVHKSPTLVTTVINSINKYKFKLDKHSASNSLNYASSVFDNNNTDSAKSHRGPSSGIMNSNSGASSVVSTSATVNLFDQQNEDDEGVNSINGLSQENIIDMILTKRKLDRAENQLHYLKRTINIAEHYNKKHIPVKTVKKLLNSYGHELDSGSLEEMAADGKFAVSDGESSRSNLSH